MTSQTATICMKITCHIMYGSIFVHSSYDKSSTLNASYKSKDELTVPNNDNSLHDPFNLLASHANPAICSLALLSPVDGAPQQPPMESNCSKLIAFSSGNLIKHNSHFASFLSLLPSFHIYTDRAVVIHKRCGGGPQYAMSERHLGEFYDP